ncbi:GNAT family N-acetyltransferase [Nocardia sp. NRRL S-836]|uniref:GNAT family N-acetyltransferase n=1 Tax=Nocardia sp. NRRL S-836 TaxID=1519492 RepID=UPI0006B043EB|nr:GNAT family protein [Nocardia sp. NRRL S-836]
MRPAYPIKTDRLHLRPFELTDLDDYAAYRTLPEVNRYLLNEVTDRAATAGLLATKTTQAELTGDGQWLALAVHWPEAGRVVGDVVLKWLSEEHRQGEIGYVLSPEFQGRGLAGEAAGALLRVGFEELGLHRITAQADPRNEASWRVMERLGMRREAHHRHHQVFKGEWADVLVYALLADEWTG